MIPRTALCDGAPCGSPTTVRAAPGASGDRSDPRSAALAESLAIGHCAAPRSLAVAIAGSCLPFDVADLANDDTTRVDKTSLTSF